MLVIDLFSGAGGLTEGFMQEQFDIIAHVEKEKWACETLKTRICYYYLKERNDLDLYWKYILKCNDYREIDKHREMIYCKYPELREKIKFEVLNKTFGNPEEDDGSTSVQEIIDLIRASLKKRNCRKRHVDVIIGGPPCQAYSIIGRARMGEAVQNDKRNYLFQYYKEIVYNFKPKVFIFENVPGILSAKDGEIIDSIAREFESIGYTLLSGENNNHKDNILNAAEFGVPQSRKRMILFGYRTKLNLNYPNFYRNIIEFNEKITTNDAIGDLISLNPGEGEDFGLYPYPKNDVLNLSWYQALMRNDSMGIMNHRARAINKDYDKQIYSEAISIASKGGQLRYSNLPEHLKTHSNQEDFQDRFKVHWWDDLPHTIVAHIAKDGHYNIHPDIKQCRSITVREAARIQSFPDNYRFEGPRTHQFMQVGNAVPPLMAHTIAKTIKQILE